MFLTEEIIKTIGKDNKTRSRTIFCLKCDNCQVEYKVLLKNSAKKEKNFCSQQCSNAAIKICIICEKEFTTGTHTTKTCSEQCLVNHRKNRKKRTDEAKSIERSCKFCNKTYVRSRERNGFCSRVCASTLYASNGTYDNWISHKKQSKDQKELYRYVSEKFPNYNFVFDKQIIISSKIYYPDIMSLERKIIIEFNGTYWHCDQRFYKEDYYHDNKKLFAKEIWNKDKERIDAFQSMGFATFEIWENDFNKNKEKVLEELILGMTKNG